MCLRARSCVCVYVYVYVGVNVWFMCMYVRVRICLWSRWQRVSVNCILKFPCVYIFSWHPCLSPVFSLLWLRYHARLPYLNILQRKLLAMIIIVHKKKSPSKNSWRNPGLWQEVCSAETLRHWRRKLNNIFFKTRNIWVEHIKVERIYTFSEKKNTNVSNAFFLHIKCLVL